MIPARYIRPQRFYQQPQQPVRPIYIKAGVIMLGGVLSYFLIKKIAKTFELLRSQKLIDTKVDGLDLGGIAANIYDAFYNNDWLGATEDELRAMSELAKLNDHRELVPKLSEIYRKQYGKILKADFISYLDDQQFTAVRSFFE